MFMPEHFRVEDVAEMHALMRAHPFAALVSMTPSGLYGTHLPTVLKEEGPCGTIECHLARANPHWKDLAKGEEAMMIFQGADGYITPNWYATKAQTGKAVPTWNYAIVHAYGRPAIMNDKDWLKRHVTELSDQQERTEAHPWKVADAPETYVDVMLRGIVGFRFEITRLEGKWKMSQNREMRDRVTTADGLERRGRNEHAQVAEVIRAHMPAK